MMYYKYECAYALSQSTKSMALSLSYAVKYESCTDEKEQERLATQAMFFQFLALAQDDFARSIGIDSEEMHKFIRLFYAADLS